MDDSFPAAEPDGGVDVVDVGAHVRKHLGTALQSYFALPVGTELPQRLAYLIERFDAAVGPAKANPENAFRDTLIGAVPALRGFAFSLAGDATRADDLVQEALVKAWANRHRFTPGTNFNAWLFTILRNQFYTEMRKAKREVEDADGIHAATLTALPDQEGVVNLRKLQDRLAGIPEAQRIALLMVGAEGYTYEEAAELLECRVGTVKSRVSRARAYLSGVLGLGDSSTTDALA
ncbi:sigma-70 family RNA polymerase sigma factor [Methylobacterium sp. WL69]|uniref:sigma-70 family RNA polymerase sigma factor n=1 Tax=Methylobacterium sp. WL69 TaxID=2603893 RepID=UPI0011CA4091|nr:sigma-70 family RNA polymerase sigma factor [Methylobacterium sp. WL69]TXM74180.1 sigma-70 family RNA polymerase sigma factor [Methylobacterium sp. WL69]